MSAPTLGHTEGREVGGHKFKAPTDGKIGCMSWKGGHRCGYEENEHGDLRMDVEEAARGLFGTRCKVGGGVLKTNCVHCLTEFALTFAAATDMREALERLLRHEVYTYEGRLEVQITVPQDDIDFARAALARALPAGGGE